MPIKIGIAGIKGRMGQALLKAALDNPAFEVTMQSSKSEPITSEFEILIDFTTPESTLENIDFCLKHHKKIIIGTTGFCETQSAFIKEASKDIAIVLSPNTSVGINLCLELLSQTTQVLETCFKDKLDIAILEAHHRYKVDSPSGTALKMAEVIKRHLNQAKAPTFSSIRAGDIVGDHTVVFATPGERIEITHKASSRETFAKGALTAALWLNDKPAGFYTMKDILKV